MSSVNCAEPVLEVPAPKLRRLPTCVRSGPITPCAAYWLVQVALDDFGTGYSSLSYLRRFPVDALKIDQSFVSHITTADSDASLVVAVISMARSLKLRVVAEGVETIDQLTFLRAHECDEAQGYYFSRPVPAQQFASLLMTGLSDIPSFARHKLELGSRFAKAATRQY